MVGSMLRSVALALGTLLLAGGALATSTISPPAGGNPLLVPPLTPVSMTLELITTDLVGGVNVEMFGNGGLTITCADATDVGAPGYACADIAGGIAVQSSDFGAGLPSGIDLVQLDFTTGSSGEALTLGTFISTNYTLCPTTLLNCILIPDGVLTAFTNDGADFVQVVPEPGTLALVAMGLVGLAIRRR